MNCRPPRPMLAKREATVAPGNDADPEQRDVEHRVGDPGLHHANKAQ